jgi:hypothetical protein
MPIGGFIASQGGLKLNGTHQLLVYADDVNILVGSTHSVKKIEAFVVASKETVLEADAQKSKNKDTRYSRLPPRKSALFWAITLRLVVRRIFLNIEDETDRLSRNVGNTTCCVKDQNSAVPQYMVMARDQLARKNHTINTGNSSFERVEEFKCL